MTAADLDELDGLLSLAKMVVPLREMRGFRGESGAYIALRHDVDDNPGALDAAVRLAAWEHARGYRSTFFFLHTAGYWNKRDTRSKLAQIAALGHEIGIHANAITEAIETGLDPASCLWSALDRLRSWGHDVIGVAPHGDSRCYERDGTLRFVNDEIFEECARPELGAPDRVVWLGELTTVRLDPKPLEYFGLAYEAYRLPRASYLSDSGDRWAPSIAEARAAFEAGLDAPLQVLVHPDWYVQAL